ncbi:hypothetical protein CPB86DRAFT_65752 [Serendipita vermifera]|nr:hypothetical protein CPB86DRAFT_65752 [Serendipita vermifera]
MIHSSIPGLPSIQTESMCSIVISRLWWKVDLLSVNTCMPLLRRRPLIDRMQGFSLLAFKALIFQALLFFPQRCNGYVIMFVDSNGSGGDQVDRSLPTYKCSDTPRSLYVGQYLRNSLAEVSYSGYRVSRIQIVHHDKGSVTSKDDLFQSNPMI